MFEINGKIYVRVSEIASISGQFDGIDKQVVENKAKIGTNVHKFISQEINGEFPIVTGKESGYFQSFKRWEEMVRPKFTASEERYYCDKKRLTGCIDALVEFEGEEETVLVDFKTSAQESPITWPMQAHLYYYLLSKSGKMISKNFIFLKLNRYGYLPTIFQYKLDNRLLDRCLQLVDDYWKIHEGENVLPQEISD